MIRQIDDNLYIEEWNKLANHPLQAWQWGEARASMGVAVLRLGKFENTKLTGVFQITIHKVPYTKYKIGYLPRSISPDREVLDWLKDYGEKHNVISYKIEPDELVSKSNNLDYPNVKKASPLFSKWSLLLDLAKSEEDLMEQMKPKTRYNIRLAERKGVEVKEVSTDEGFDIFSKLYFATTKRQGYSGHDEEYHRKVWQAMKDGVAHILVAFYNDKPLAAYELFLWHGKLYYPYGGSALEKRQVMAPNLLMWEAIKFGKKHGAKNFDMWAASSPNGEGEKDKGFDGFTKFKLGYGAEYIEFVGSFDLVVKPFLYNAFSLVEKLKRLFLNISRGYFFKRFS